MSISAINQASGADLLNLFAENSGSAAATTSRASQFALKQAITLAQNSEAQIVSEIDSVGLSSGTNLNVYA